MANMAIDCCRVRDRIRKKRKQRRKTSCSVLEFYSTLGLGLGLSLPGLCKEICTRISKALFLLLSLIWNITYFKKIFRMDRLKQGFPNS